MTLPAASVSLLGGTGRSGPGLALRFALAGVRVHIGSRDATKGMAAAAEVAAQVAGLGRDAAGEITGHSNADAAALAEVAFVTVPYEGLAALLGDLSGVLANRPVVSTVVPMGWSKDRGPEAVAVPEGSAAEQTAALLPDSLVVAGFHSLSSAVLSKPERGLDQHVIITGDHDGAKRIAMGLAELLPGVGAVDGGPLRYARHSEGLTVLLLSINRVYKGRHSGVLVTDLD